MYALIGNQKKNVKKIQLSNEADIIYFQTQFRSLMENTNPKTICRTATNVYLLNVAIADLAILVLALPNELYHLWEHYPWRLGDLACDIKVVVQEAITYVSILTILGTGSDIILKLTELSVISHHFYIGEVTFV